MTKNEKNKLAKLCGLVDERYTDMVKEDVKKEYRLEDEIAILRKLLASILELHKGEIDDIEFTKYHTFVEQIKASAKEDVG